MSLLLLPVKAANIWYMNVCNQSEHILPNMRSWKSLTLHWRSFSECGSEHVTEVLLSKGSQYLIHECLQLIRTRIIQDAKLKIIDAPLALNLRKGRCLCCCLFCLYNLPIHWLCIAATKSLCNYHTYKTTNRWRSVDAHSQNGALTVLLSLLPI